MPGPTSAAIALPAVAIAGRDVVRGWRDPRQMPLTAAPGIAA
jgi:hypothetical protein